MRPSAIACFSFIDPDLDHAFSGFSRCPRFFSFAVNPSVGFNDSEDDEEDELEEDDELDEEEDEAA
jgi:hypothetical protein